MSADVRVTAADSDGSSTSAAVTADVIRPDGTLAATGVTLHDDGVAPDSVAGDGFYAVTLNSLSLEHRQEGIRSEFRPVTDKER